MTRIERDDSDRDNDSDGEAGPPTLPCSSRRTERDDSDKEMTWIER